MVYLYVLAIVLHVASAAAWFGLSLRLPALSKDIGSADTEAGRVLAESGASTVNMMTKFVGFMYIFGIGAIFLGPGFAELNWTFHMAMGLGGILLLVQALVIKPSWTALVEAVGSDASAARKRVAMSIGIGHLLWMTLLVLMFLPRVMY